MAVPPGSFQLSIGSAEINPEPLYH